MEGDEACRKSFIRRSLVSLLVCLKKDKMLDITSQPMQTVLIMF
jgi:hypothetical protein